MQRTFKDRREAGRVLGEALKDLSRRGDVLVLALPRGGVPVAAEVAAALKSPLDVFVVRKLGVPGHEELAMGAIASGGVRVVNQDVVRDLRLDEGAIQKAAEEQQKELDRREEVYRRGRPAPTLKGRAVVLVDDGLATGSTMKAAVAAARAQDAGEVIVAVPVAAPTSRVEIESDADRFVCPMSPPGFMAVGQWYDDFDQTTDEEVQAILSAADRRE